MYKNFKKLKIKKNCSKEQKLVKEIKKTLYAIFKKMYIYFWT